MKTETAKEIALNIEKDFQKFFKVKYEFRNAVEKAMIEYAESKCTEQREISWKLFQSSEIDGKKITLDAKTPDLK